VTLALMGRFREGAEALRQAVTLNPKDAEGRYNLGVISLEALKDRDGAAEQYEALRGLSPALAEKLRALMK
jgi:tetratricopeptide (TPR) repeat protein